ncbi:ankyrin [Backusella circina FSU 941]|nr:ankyrin [Backusella circina FSU 941]
MKKRIAKNSKALNTFRMKRLRALLKMEPYDSVLLAACARRSPQDVRDIIESDPDINPDEIRDHNIRTPLHIACGRRDNHAIATSIAEILIESGSDVNNGVGDKDGLQPMHMAVLAGNYQCVLLLLRQGATIPASSPFRLTPLLLAKLKLDNLKKMNRNEDISQSNSTEYNDLTSITQVLVTHLANKHTSNSNHHHGLSDFLFSKTTDELNDTISSITHQLSAIEVDDDASLNGLIVRVKELGIHEK